MIHDALHVATHEAASREPSPADVSSFMRTGVAAEPAYSFTKQQPFRQAELLHYLAKTPDRGMVRGLGVERDAAKAAERQPVALGLLGLERS